MNRRDLIVLEFTDGKVVRCESFDDALTKARAYDVFDGSAVVTGIHKEGGPVTSLMYDRQSDDWVPVSNKD